MTALLTLLPKLQSLRLWDTNAGIHKIESMAELRWVTSPLVPLIRSTLLHSSIPFAILHSISLPVYGPYDILVLACLPAMKAADIHILRGRISRTELPYTVIRHVENLHFAFGDAYTHPEGYFDALAGILGLFEGMGVDKGSFPTKKDCSISLRR